MQDDLFTTFRRRYAKGEGINALRALISSPSVSYDQYDLADEECQHLLNYADALAFGWPDEARQANLIVQADAPLGEFGEALIEDETWLWQRSIVEAPYDLAAGEPAFHQRLVESLAHYERWEACKQVFGFLEGPATMLPLLFDPVPTPPLPEFPAILMEPRPFTLDERPTLLLFLNIATLQHCLALPGFWDTMRAPNRWIHILDHHPSKTLAHQPSLPDVTFTFVSHFEEVLTGTFEQIASAGRQLSWKLRGVQLGHRRQIAHRTNCHQDGWHSLHKSFPISHPLPPRLPRTPTALTRIAHIVPQVIDAGHAPTRLYRAIVPNHTLETHLLVTDEHVYRTSNYPYPRYYSEPSQARGARSLESLAVPTWFGSQEASYERLAAALCKELERRKIDVAIFHTASPFMQMAASRCCTPCIALFDHGELVPGFDLYFAATSQNSGLSGPVITLPHIVDVTEGWSESPYPISYFGLSEDAQLLTTISYHLDNRLSEQMCEAIAEILVQCPRAHYLPIGPVDNPHRIRAPFLVRHVADRLHFLGAQSHPSQLARSMHLYLNEFPFGGGLALLDSAGAGVPIVSMYDPDGPYQARAAGNLYGLDRVITSRKPTDYIDLACRLLNDRVLYAEWSVAALAAYRRRGSPATLALRIETALHAWFAR